jgi:hypothetical protein
VVKKNCKYKSCENQALRKGLCKKHLIAEVKKRSKKSLLLNNSCKTNTEVAWNFIKWASEQDTEDCIEWPFATDTRGYPVITETKKGRSKRYFARPESLSLVCKKPSKKYLCWSEKSICRSRTCINPKHMYWGTKKEETLKQWKRENIRAKKT